MSVIGISLAETNLAERPSHSQREREREESADTCVEPGATRRSPGHSWPGRLNSEQ